MSGLYLGKLKRTRPARNALRCFQNKLVKNKVKTTVRCEGLFGFIPTDVKGIQISFSHTIMMMKF